MEKIQLTKVTRRGRATTGHHPSKPSTDLDRFVLASPAHTNPKTSQLPAASVLTSVLTMSPKVARPIHHMDVDAGFRHEAPCTREDGGYMIFQGL